MPIDWLATTVSLRLHRRRELRLTVPSSSTLVKISASATTLTKTCSMKPKSRIRPTGLESSRNLSHSSHLASKTLGRTETTQVVPVAVISKTMSFQLMLRQESLQMLSNLHQRSSSTQCFAFRRATLSSSTSNLRRSSTPSTLKTRF